MRLISHFVGVSLLIYSWALWLLYSSMHSSVNNLTSCKSKNKYASNIASLYNRIKRTLKPVCIGFTACIDWSITPLSKLHNSIPFDVKSGPLSNRMATGLPRCLMILLIVQIPHFEEFDASISMANNTLVPFHLYCLGFQSFYSQPFCL